MMSRLKSLAFSFLPRQKRFERIFEKNHWGSPESASGHGSTLAATSGLRARLPTLIAELEVESVLDVPCGDFNWMSHVVSQCPGLEYTGYDIVPQLVSDAQSNFGTPNVRFEHRDVIKDPLPTVDLIICRDFLIHMSFRDAKAVIENFKKSGSKWLLANTYRGIQRNADISTGRWRFIDLEKHPYDLPPPTLRIEEDEAEGKQIALWPIADLP